MWTQFHDMHSGGSQKEKWSKIFIEAPENEAVSVFYAKFGHNPHRVTCTCCGPDYSISEEETLEQITAWSRRCDFDEKLNKWVERPATAKYLFGGQYRTLDEYIEYSKTSEGFDNTATFIYASEITDDERKAVVPEQGYVWVD